MAAGQYARPRNGSKWHGSEQFRVIIQAVPGKCLSPCVVEYRSEEHTSELQSLMRNSYAVFCFKKKKIITRNYKTMSAKSNNRHTKLHHRHNISYTVKIYHFEYLQSQVYAEN